MSATPDVPGGYETAESSDPDDEGNLVNDGTDGPEVDDDDDEGFEPDAGE